VLAQLFVPRTTGIHILLENLSNPGLLRGQEITDDSVVDRDWFSGSDGVIFDEVPLDPVIVDRGELSPVPVLCGRFYR
jgi:hypothetical protein